MRLLVQRVREASVEADGNVVARIGAGLLVLAGIAGDDTADDREWLARKLVELRIFDDDQGVMNRSVLDAGGDGRAADVALARAREGGAAPPALDRLSAEAARRAPRAKGRKASATAATWRAR